MDKDQESLNNHVRACERCLNAKNLQECCQIGRVLAMIIESKRTR
jgi:hypothetical protein